MTPPQPPAQPNRPNPGPARPIRSQTPTAGTPTPNSMDTNPQQQHGRRPSAVWTRGSRPAAARTPTRERGPSAAAAWTRTLRWRGRLRHSLPRNHQTSIAAADQQARTSTLSSSVGRGTLGGAATLGSSADAGLGGSGVDADPPVAWTPSSPPPPKPPDFRRGSRHAAARTPTLSSVDSATQQQRGRRPSAARTPTLSGSVGREPSAAAWTSTFGGVFRLRHPSPEAIRLPWRRQACSAPPPEPVLDFFRYMQ